jgi:hypothetical protein
VRPVRSRSRRLPPLVIACAALASVAVTAQWPSGPEHPAIAYSTSAPTDAVARLQQQIDAGSVTLEWTADHGYLPSVLRHLAVPISSQGLVFSRTSLQVDRITPWTPRAVYFNDDVYVAWVQGGPMMEIASADPKLGAVFYTLTQQPSARPTFERQTHSCLQCHDSSSITGGVPGFILRSVFADRYGYVIAPIGEGATTDRTAIEQRWGGWYVTGAPGGPRHVGNVISPRLGHEIGSTQAELARLMLAAAGNVADLSGRFDVAPYLTPHSDIVALMVLAHQSAVHNLITFANFEARRALYDEEYLISEKGGAAGRHLDITIMHVEGAAERLVRAMLFTRSAPFAAPIQGTSSFAADFSARGPRDRAGRSLRDLDLKERLFRYPLSYLIYSEDFDALPGITKAYVYRRLRAILTGEDASPEFGHLSKADREAILAILEETKPDFPR